MKFVAFLKRLAVLTIFAGLPAYSSQSTTMGMIFEEVNLTLIYSYKIFAPDGSFKGGSSEVLFSESEKDRDEIKNFMNAGSEDEIQCKKSVLKKLTEVAKSFKLSEKLSPVLKRAEKLNVKPYLRLTLIHDGKSMTFSDQLFVRLDFLEPTPPNDYGKNRSLFGSPLMLIDFDAFTPSQEPYGIESFYYPEDFKIFQQAKSEAEGLNLVGSCRTLHIIDKPYKMYETPIFEESGELENSGLLPDAGNFDDLFD